MKVGSFLLAVGILCIVLSEGNWGNPSDCINLICGIAASAWGMALLAVRGNVVDPLESVSLSSIGITYSGSIADRMAIPGWIASGKVNRPDFIPEVTVVKNTDDSAIEPPSTFRKQRGERRLESLMSRASQLLKQD